MADRYGLVPFSKTPFLLVAGWISLRLRGLRWRDTGFVRPVSWARAMAVGTVAGLLMETLAVLVTEPAIERLLGVAPDRSDFRSLTGNLPLLLIVLALNWSLAAFGEELVYRGYVMQRFADLLSGVRGRWLVSLGLVSVLFGLAHHDQGPSGMVQEGLAGFLLGLLYLASGRTLAVPIIAHGVSNTLALVLIYLGRYRGL